MIFGQVDPCTPTKSPHEKPPPIHPNDRRDRHIRPAERIAAIIEKFDIAVWMSGHEHHTPYTPKHIARVDKTTYINVASMSHAYNSGSSESFLLEFVPGTKQIVARRRKHDTKAFIPEYEVTIPLKHRIELG